MTREIKFRAWNKANKVMHLDLDPTSSPQYTSLNLYLDRIQTACVVMQYTGLKDKNGVEIFEGDIVSFPDTETESVDVGVGMIPVAQTELNSWGVVEEKDYCWGLNVEMETEVIEKGFNSFYEIDQNFGFDDFEIIGNIYENPELLK